MPYSDDDKRRVLEATDIVSLIGEQVALKRVGRRWVGICPFHSEDTPSLSVNPEQGLYYCFGCHASGDAISFVTQVYRLEFTESLEHLAQRAGVRMTPLNRAEGENRSKREGLLDILSRAQDYFCKMLEDPLVGERARAYLKSRDISPSAIKHFRIGFAPEDGRSLTETLRASKEDLVSAGLGYLDDRGRLRDQFRGRIIFPITDTSGRVVAFGGRILPEIAARADRTVTLAKYKNSPETVVYQKRRVLYGLDQARGVVVNTSEIVVCEGYTDVIGFWQAGVENAVATCGTALSEEHFERLKNFAKKVVLAFDADGAGQDAAERFYQMERRHNLHIAVARLPEGKDPADLGRDSPELLKAAVKEAEPFLAFRLRRLFARSDLGTSEGRAEAADLAIAMVVEHPNPLVRSDYLGLIGDVTRTEVSELRKRVERRPTPLRRTRALDAAGETLASGPKLDRSSQEALRLLIHSPSELHDVLSPWLFRDAVARNLAWVLVESDSTTSAAKALEGREDEVAKLFYRLASEPSPMDMLDVLTTFVAREAKHELTMVSQRLRRGSGRVDLADLSLEIGGINRLLEELKNGEDGGESTGELISWLVKNRESDLAK